MNVNLEYLISVVGPACHAAYEAQLAVTVFGSMPPGYELVSRLVRPSSPVKSMPAKAMAQDGNVFGYVALNHATQRALIGFRGSRDIGDWIDDIEFCPALCVLGVGFVHDGFQEVYLSVRDSLHAALSGLSGYSGIDVVGHSLGGALAILAGYDIGHNGPMPTVYTISAPAVAGVLAPFRYCEFAEDFALHSEYLRLENKWDIVPHLPTPPGYQHLGDKLLVDGAHSFNVRTAHRIDSVTAGVQKMMAATDKSWAAKQ